MHPTHSDTHPVRTGEELNEEVLSKYLRAQLPEEMTADREMALEQFPGGHSNLTYCVKFGEHEFVLRRPPVGPVAPTAHDMPREFRMLAAINPVFPLAPKPYVLCEDTSIIGVPFYLMERRRGLVVRRDLPPEVGEDLSWRRRVSESLIDALADLHAIDLEKKKPHAFGEARRLCRTASQRMVGALATGENERSPRNGKLG